MLRQTRYLKILFCCGLLLLFNLSVQIERVHGSPVQGMIIPTSTTPGNVVLSISNVTSVAGANVTVPVQFQTSSREIDTVIFAVDYDQNCLRMNTIDANNNNLPDAITINAPTGSFQWVAFNPEETNSELKFAISSLTSLAEAAPLLTLEFTTTCTNGTALVNFATVPAVSFGASGIAIAGEAINGSVSITTPPVTPTPVSNLLLISPGDIGGIVDGLPFQDEDILAYDTLDKQWSIVFDGSDVGWGKVDLEAFDLLPDGSLLLTPSKKLIIPGLGEVMPSDILRFIPKTLGIVTTGVWEWYFDGSDVGLSSNSEYIDAIAFDPEGRLLISSEGSFDAGSVKGEDEDLFVFNKLSLGANTTGNWELYFDGSRIALTKGDEDIDAGWVKPTGEIYLSTKGKFATASGRNLLNGDQNDIFICNPVKISTGTDCSFASFFDGDADHFKYNIDDIGFIAVEQLHSFTQTTTALGAESNREQYVIEPADQQRSLRTDAELTEKDMDYDELLNQRIFLPLIAK